MRFVDGEYMSRILHGFGGCKFEKDGVTAIFNGGEGIIEWIPFDDLRQTVNGTYTNLLDGFNVEITCKSLYNIGSSDYLQYKHLANILTYMVGLDQTMTVTPRNDDSMENPLSFECFLDGSITFEDIHRVKIGQVCSLKFICKDLFTSIPDSTSDELAPNYIDDSGNEYVDDSGNTYIGG